MLTYIFFISILFAKVTKLIIVQVSGTAEYTLQPDQSILTIIISNKKEKAEEARTSVTRRLEYVTQTLYNNGLSVSFT